MEFSHRFFKMITIVNFNHNIVHIILHPNISERGPYDILISDFGCKRILCFPCAGVVLIDSSKIVTNVCPFLATTMQLFLHLKVNERGPHNVAIGDFGAVFGGSLRGKTWGHGFNLWDNFCDRYFFKLRGRKCIHFLRHCNYFSCHGFWKTGLQHLDKWILTVWGCGPYEAKRESHRLHSHKKIGLKESKDKRCHTSMTIMLSFSPHSFKGGLEVQNHCHRWSKKEEFVSCV